jgi:hypothetical protein
MLSVLLRSLPGVVFLPGLAFALARGTSADRLLVLTFILPVLSGPSQDRYLLPIQPILLFYAALLLQVVWRRLSRTASA